MAKVIANVGNLLRRLKSIANVDLEEVVKTATVLVHGQAVMLAPVNNGLLRESIHMSVKKTDQEVIGRVYTNNEYAPYVEFGTGIRGNGTYKYNVKGLSLSYRNSPWFIPAEKISDSTAEKYHFQKITFANGTSYYISYGQVAQPFMYPALDMNKDFINNSIAKGVKEALASYCKGGK